MRWIAYVTGFVVLLGLGVFAIVAGRVPSRPPSTEACVDLWNAPGNGSLRARVAAHGYRVARIGGAYVEERYEGCFASFVERVDEPWALYSATRVPFEDRPLRWKVDAEGREWGTDSPGGGEPVPRSNAVVLADGSLSLSR